MTWTKLLQTAWDLLHMKPAQAPEQVWLLIDISNGLDGSKNYCWWFTSSRAASNFKKEHLKQHRKLHKERGFGLAALVGPFPYALVKRR